MKRKWKLVLVIVLLAILADGVKTWAFCKHRLHGRPDVHLRSIVFLGFWITRFTYDGFREDIGVIYCTTPIVPYTFKEIHER